MKTGLRQQQQQQQQQRQQQQMKRGDLILTCNIFTFRARGVMHIERGTQIGGTVPHVWNNRLLPWNMWIWWMVLDGFGQK